MGSTPTPGMDPARIRPFLLLTDALRAGAGGQPHRPSRNTGRRPAASGPRPPDARGFALTKTVTTFPPMSFIILVLAIAGFLAVLRRSAGALLRLLGRGVEAFLAREESSIRERRGDLTGLQEAVARTRGARRARLDAMLRFAFWVALLVAPLLTPWTALLYAACATLWLVPPRPA